MGWACQQCFDCVTVRLQKAIVNAMADATAPNFAPVDATATANANCKNTIDNETAV